MKNVTSQKVNGVTAKIQIESGEKRGHLTTYKSLEDMVKYMTDNDVIHKFANIENDLYTIDLQKSDEANENEYENSMRINDKNFPQPTNMWK